MAEQHQQQHPYGARPALAAPRLQLPRFEFAPRAAAHPVHPAAPTIAATAAPATAPAAIPAPPQLFVHQPRPRPQVQPQLHPSQAQPQPAVTYSSTHVAAPVVTPLAVSVSPQPMMRTAPAVWSEPSLPEQRTILQRITPVHMGALLILVVLVMVMTSGPAAVSTGPVKLPAVVTGGGGSGAGAVDAMQPPRTGIPTAPGTATRNRTAVPRARAQLLRVGSATVPARVTAGGIPSPAAAAQLAVAGGGRLAPGHTGSATMAGMPSPAAAAKLGPEQLPFRPSDGVTLPRASGERDAHATDTHYGTASLPMEEPAAPVMTPAASAANAERRVVLDELTGGTQSSNPVPAAPAAGYASAY